MTDQEWSTNGLGALIGTAAAVIFLFGAPLVLLWASGLWRFRRRSICAACRGLVYRSGECARCGRVG